MRSDIQIGFVLQACRNRRAVGPYYGGDGQWTTFDNAKIFYSRGAMRKGLSEARWNKPDSAPEIHAFEVILS